MVRFSVAQHNHPDILSKLVKDIDCDVRWAVAQHKNKDILEILKNDENDEVKQQVIKTLSLMS